MKSIAGTLTVLVFLISLGTSVSVEASDEEAIVNLTKEFCRSIVAKDLSVLDRVFDSDPSNIYYDINEGPLVGMDRLRRVWRAATTNYTISRFDFTDDMSVTVRGDRAVQIGTWEQTQVQKDGHSRDISGRATILWKSTPEGWRVYHYHASITPLRERR